MKKAGEIAILLIIFISISSCKHQKAKQDNGNTPVRVTLSVIRPVDVSYYESYPANVVALMQVEIHSEVSGYITGIFFNEGSRVKKGQKLYEIDRRQYEAAYEVAKDNLKIAESNLERVQIDADRYVNLSKQDAIAKQQLDHSMTDLANAKLHVSSAKQELEKAKINYDYSLLTAPFDGTIGISQVKLGAIVVPGQTLLNTISSDDPTGVDFEIDERELGRFQELENRKATDKDTLYRIALPGDGIYPISGKIDLIDRAVDPQTGTITVRLIFPNPEHSLRPGMSCQAKVLHEGGEKHILIPFKAVTEQMGEYFVYKVIDNKATQVKVVTGVRIGPDIVVATGLQPGDQIVLEGIDKIHDGSAVTTSEANVAENSAGRK